VGNSLWLPCRLAPNEKLAIHSLPIAFLPEDPEDLVPCLPQSILNSKNVRILVTRYLNPDPEPREGKPTTAVIVSIYSGDAPTIGSSIRLFSRSRTIERAYSQASNRYTQYNNCWGFGHITPQARCPSTSPVCPICSLDHTRASDHCPNPTCPGGGNLKTTPGCCSSSPAGGINCGGDHTAVYRDCESRLTPPTVKRSATAAEIVPPPPVGDAMDTAANDQDILPTPSHTHSLQSAFEMATPSAIRTTILPASVTRTQGTCSLPPVEPASTSPISRTPSGLAH